MKFRIFALALLTSAHTLAQSNELAGLGLQSCGKYIDLRRSQNKLNEMATASWVQGYLTAFNMMRGQAGQERFLIPEPDTLLLMIEKACLANPELNVMLATGLVVNKK